MTPGGEKGGVTRPRSSLVPLFHHLGVIWAMFGGSNLETLWYLWLALLQLRWAYSGVNAPIHYPWNVLDES